MSVKRDHPFQAFTNILYDIATRPEYVEPMRKELEAMIREEGLSKVSIGKLRKLDSFIKESLRLSPIGACKSSAQAIRATYLLQSPSRHAT